MNCIKNICLVYMINIFITPVHSFANPGKKESSSPRIVNIPKDLAGLRIIKIDKDGQDEEIQCSHLLVAEKGKNILQAEWKEKSGQTFRILFYEDRFEVDCETTKKNFKWALELKTAPGIQLPFRSVGKHKITASLNDFKYAVTCKPGYIQKAVEKNDYLFRFIREGNKLVINCNNKSEESNH